MSVMVRFGPTTANPIRYCKGIQATEFHFCRQGGKTVATLKREGRTDYHEQQLVEGRTAKAIRKWGRIVKVADILALKGSAKITIMPSETIETLSLLLRTKRIGAAVVSSDGQTIEGVISERDLAYGLAVHRADLHTLPVSALMTKTVITCTPNDDIALVASTMLSQNIRHLPVEAEKRLVGMVSIRDVLNFRVDELQQQTAQFRTFVNQMGHHAPQDRE